jgi:hypothetical protein
LYAPAYPSLGLTEEDVKALPFEAWHGNLTTNELSFTNLPGAGGQLGEDRFQLMDALQLRVSRITGILFTGARPPDYWQRSSRVSN